MADFVLGLEGKLYYAVGGQGGSFLEITNCKNAKLNGSTDTADVTTRAQQGWKAMVGTLRDASIEFEMLWSPTDAAFTALRNAWLANAAADKVIGIRFLDKDAGQGFQGDMTVTNFSWDQSLPDAQVVSVTVQPTFSLTPPSWITA